MTEILENRIKELRHNKEFTQDYLADKVKITVYHMNKIENHKRPLTTTLASRLAKELGVTIGDIFLK